MLRPALLVSFLLTTIGVLKGFDIIYVLTGGGPGIATTVLSMFIYTWAFGYNNLHVAASLSILFLVLVISFVALVMRLTSVEKYLGIGGIRK